MMSNDFKRSTKSCNRTSLSCALYFDAASSTSFFGAIFSIFEFCSAVIYASMLSTTSSVICISIYWSPTISALILQRSFNS